jgi:hypothetical protein
MRTLLLTPEQELQLLEIAWRCLADGDMFDQMAEKLDLSDSEMLKLRDALENYLLTREGADRLMRGRWLDDKNAQEGV